MIECTYFEVRTSFPVAIYLTLANMVDKSISSFLKYIFCHAVTFPVCLSLTSANLIVQQLAMWLQQISHKSMISINFLPSIKK